jgi:phosphoglycerol transferase MdoB-like AlkP superfamily enzyme
MISFKMLWQSYPVLWILSGFALSAGLTARLFKKTHVSILKKNTTVNNIYNKQWHAGTIVFMAWCLYGVFSFAPLKWSEAFKFNNNFRSYLALNPLQNFFTTLWFRIPSFEKENAKKYHPVMANFLSLDDANISSKTYNRIAEPVSKSLESKPNVVLVICESFSMYKSTMSGNPLNTTPYFDKLCQEGIFFDKCFSATFGTARGVFAILTGTPDVQLSKFSTRNTATLDQHTIINNFEDYTKMYFLGGSSTFNNFEGLIRNINSVKIYQDGSYKSPQLNVWGISDKNLLLEANDVLKKQDKPFFAIIQTSGNHRPFSIPKEDKDFERRIVPPDTLNKYGFESLQEFQAFCYTDYSFKKFIEAAKQQPYFQNTIFVFIGDHGVKGNALEMYPDAWTSSQLSDEHVPLLFYAPGLLTPQHRKEIVSQIDVLPTLAGMVHQPYKNTTLGRDVLNMKSNLNAAFIIQHDEGNIGVITDNYYYVKSIRIKREELVPVRDNVYQCSAQQDSVKESLSTLTSAIYETSKWMLFNNNRSKY